MPIVGLAVAAIEALVFKDRVSRLLATVGGLLCLVLSYHARRRT